MVGLEDIRKRERKILRKIPGPRLKHGEIGLTHGTESRKQTRGGVEVMKKRRLNFYRCFFRTDRDKLTKRLFEFFRLTKTSAKIVLRSEN